MASYEGIPETNTSDTPVYIYKGYCPSCDQGFGMEEGDTFTYIMGNRCVKCPTCGANIIIPAFDDNNDGHVTQDENSVYTGFENPNYFRRIVTTENSDELGDDK